MTRRRRVLGLILALSVSLLLFSCGGGSQVDAHQDRNEALIETLPDGKGRPSSSPASAKAAGWQGMTVSCPGSGSEWGTDMMLETLDELKELGCEWVTIHPYAGIRQDGSVPVWGSIDAPPRYVTRPIREAHKRGMKIMIKPHLGYWGSGFSWRGAIEFDSKEKWQRFFSQYRRWIVRMAEFSREADVFCVGTELDKTIQYEEEWRRIIREVRVKYPGELTYAANWPDYQRVKFWDALDYIGAQAYFPILAHGVEPTQGNIEAGWQRLLEDITRY